MSRTTVADNSNYEAAGFTREDILAVDGVDAGLIQAALAHAFGDTEAALA